MFGVVTRNEEELTWPEFDRGFFEVKDVTGRQTDPVADGVNMVSCFGDSATADARPDLVPVDADGTAATREQPYFDWGYVCPSEPDYRAGLLAIVDECAAANPDVRLDDVGFPRRGYCRCDRCETAFAGSDETDWLAWRAGVITAFVEAAADRIPGRTYLTLYPDPYPGHLRERAGVDLDALAGFVDEFVVPLYDTAYGTTYWLEVIASGFADRLPADLGVELYAVDVDVENLVHAAEVAEAYADGVYFGYEAGNARAAVRRLKADRRAGETFG